MSADRIARIVMFESALPIDLAKVIDQLFGEVLDAGDYSVDCRFEDL